MRAVEMNVILSAGMHSLVPCFAVNKTVILQLWKYVYGSYDLGCARNMKILRANRGGGGVGKHRVTALVAAWPRVRARVKVYWLGFWGIMVEDGKCFDAGIPTDAPPFANISRA